MFSTILVLAILAFIGATALIIFSAIDLAKAKKTNQSEEAKRVAKGKVFFTVLILCLNVCLFAAIFLGMENRNLRDEMLKDERNAPQGFYDSIAEDSPYRNYIDALLNDTLVGYNIVYMEKDNFIYYYAEIGDGQPSHCPSCIAYVRYNGEITEDKQMSLKLERGTNSSTESIGAIKQEMLFVGESINEMPKRIIVKILPKTKVSIESVEPLEEASFLVYKIG